jgi:hypothetical protein
MRKITGDCSETALVPTEGIGYALEVKLTSAGDEAVPVSGIFLSRKGVNVLPEFAQGFGMDTSHIIQGLPPERYQVRVQMLASRNGSLMYGDGKSEFQFPPGRDVRFVMPIPFQGLQFFLNAPPEDLFIAATSLSGDEQIIEMPNLHEVIRQTLETHGHLGGPVNVMLSVIVPSSKPPTEEMERMVGTVNEKPIGPMPNN